MTRATLITLCLLFAPARASAQETQLEGLRSAVRSAPRDYDAQLALGHALIEAGRYRQATATLSRAARLRSGDPVAQYEPIRVLFAQHAHQRARAACRRIQRVARDSAISHVCQARAFLAWNRSGRAFEHLEAALQQAPNDYEALLALGDAHRLRAAVSEAESAYRQAIQARSAASEPHLGLGQLYAQAHRRDDALRALRRAHELAPDDPDVDYQLGRLLSGQEAVTHFRDAVANRPGWSSARAELADTLLALGQTEAAIAEYRAAISRDRHLAHARAGLGRALIAAGNLADAEETLDRALEMVPNDAGSTMALADVYAGTDRIEEAYEQYRRAADLDARDPEPLVRAGRLAISQQRPVLGVGFLQRVLAAHGDYAPALALMGDVMRGRNRATQAREFYQRALRGTGDFDRAAVQAAMRALR